MGEYLFVLTPVKNVHMPRRTWRKTKLRINDKKYTREWITEKIYPAYLTAPYQAEI